MAWGGVSYTARTNFVISGNLTGLRSRHKIITPQVSIIVDGPGTMLQQDNALSTTDLDLPIDQVLNELEHSLQRQRQNLPENHPG